MKRRLFTIILMSVLFTCLFCGLTACSEKHAHSYVETVTTPTCTEKGLTTYTCSCGDTYTEEIPALTHDTTAHAAKAATCTTIGWYEYETCNRQGCGYSTYKEIAAQGHTYQKTVVSPTETTMGTIERTCFGCSYSYSVSIFATTSLAYTVNAADKTCTVTGIGEFTGTEIYIPTSLGGYKVTAIAEKAFENQSQVTVLELPTTIETIGTRAFYGCSGLTEMTIPSSVTSIGTQIFYKTGIETVYYNSSYSSSSNSFFDVSQIKTVVFNGTSVPNVLKNCVSINKIIISNGVTSIGFGAFENCSSLTSITIPDSVTSIGYGSFSGCSSLTSITIPDSVTSIGEHAFFRCSSLTSITIPDSVTSIGEQTFNFCSSLTSIAIPDSVTSIGVLAFNFCSSLTSITIPDSVTSIGKYAFNFCSSLTTITIPDSVTSIGYEAFSGCSSLTSITIPDSVTSIGEHAFSGCRSLTRVYYSGTAEDWAKISIGSYNTVLTNVTRYYYSETQPTTAGRYWHYVNGVPTAW